MSSVVIDNKSLVIKGRLFKTARLQDEYYVPAGDPSEIIPQLRASSHRVDIFTFVQEIHDPTPHYEFHQVCDELAVLPIKDYDFWFNKQLYFKPRNKLRKALKSGVQVKVVAFTDELVGQIKAVYDEAPVRQDKRNWNYGKDLGTLKREHSTFLDTSEFIGAFVANELIGFAKLTCSGKTGMLMNIVAKNSHRNKAPSNALIAKSVELCAARQLTHLAYGSWRGRGLQDFKVANGFQRYQVPRYFVPLTMRGTMALGLRLHLKPVDYLPRWCIESAARLRGHLLALRFKRVAPTGE
jgi:hypothetical protein